MIQKRKDMKRGDRQETFGSRSITKYSPELALKICEKVAEGNTLLDICKEAGMPHRASFQRWVMLYKDVAVSYQAARELSAQSLEDEALGLARKLSGPNDFTTVKVRAIDIALQQIRWSATRRDPSKYGQKARETITVPIQINTTLYLGGDNRDSQRISTITAKVVTPTGKYGWTPPENPDRRVIPKK